MFDGLPSYSGIVLTQAGRIVGVAPHALVADQLDVVNDALLTVHLQRLRGRGEFEQTLDLRLWLLYSGWRR